MTRNRSPGPMDVCRRFPDRRAQVREISSAGRARAEIRAPSASAHGAARGGPRS